MKIKIVLKACIANFFYYNIRCYTAIAELHMSLSWSRKPFHDWLGCLTSVHIHSDASS